MNHHHSGLSFPISHPKLTVPPLPCLLSWSWNSSHDLQLVKPYRLGKDEWWLFQSRVWLLQLKQKAGHLLLTQPPPCPIPFSCHSCPPDPLAKSPKSCLRECCDHRNFHKWPSPRPPKAEIQSWLHPWRLPSPTFSFYR